MKRTVVLPALALLTGLAAGYTLGIHKAVTPSPHAASLMGPVSSAGSAPGLTVAPPARAPAGGPRAAFTLAEAKQTLAAWLAAGSPREARGEIDEAVTIWSASDPHAALEFVFNAPRFPWRNSALSIPLAAIARDDPDQVSAWLRGHLPESDCGEVVSQVITEIFQRAPRAALTLAEAPGFGFDRHYFGMILGELVRVSPGEALAAFGRLSEGGRSETAATIASAWAKTDLAAALHWTESLVGLPGAEEAQRGLFAQLAWSDPAQALALLGQSTLSPDAARGMAYEIARRQPDIVMRNILQIPRELRLQAFTIAAAESFDSDPDRIAALARNSGLSAEQTGAIIGTAWNRWLDQDRLAAEAWGDSVQDPVLRTQIELQKLRDAAATDPSLFLSSVGNLPSAQTEKQLIQSALSSLTPLQAGDWIASHPGLVDPSFAAQITTRYFGWNRDQAAAWVDRLPPGEAQNRSLAGLALSWVEAGDSARASSSLGAIADPRLQTSARFQVFNTLYRNDPASAVQWLGTQPVAPEIRANWETLAAATPSPDAMFEYHD